MELLIAGNTINERRETWEVLFDHYDEASTYEQFRNIVKQYDYIIVLDLFEYEDISSNEFISVLSCRMREDGELFLLSKNIYSLANLDYLLLPFGKPKRDRDHIIEALKREGIRIFDEWVIVSRLRAVNAIIPANVMQKMPEDELYSHFSDDYEQILPKKVIRAMLKSKLFDYLSEGVVLHAGKADFKHKLKGVVVRGDGTTNRYKLATVIFDDEVYKIPLDRESVPYVNAIFQNMCKLESRGISIVKQERIKDGVIKMPYITIPLFDEVLYEAYVKGEKEKIIALITEYKKFLELMPDVTEGEVSELFALYEGQRAICFKHGYLDLKFENLFYDSKGFHVIDQEYVRENVPLDAVLLFAVRRFYTVHPKAEDSLPECELLSILGVRNEKGYLEAYKRMGEELFCGEADDKELVWNNSWTWYRNYQTNRDFHLFNPNVYKTEFLLVQKGCTTIAIYGYGRLGRLMESRLSRTNIKVACIIDRNMSDANMEKRSDYYRNSYSDDIEADAVLICLMSGEADIIREHRNDPVPWYSIKDFI